MTPERIAEIRKLADAATKGPWFVGQQCDGAYLHIMPRKESSPGSFEGMPSIARPSGPYYASCEGKDAADKKAEANARFISAARTAVPELLDDLARLRDLVWRLRDAVINTRAHGQYAELLAEAGGAEAMSELSLKAPCSFLVRSKGVHSKLCELNDKYGSDGWDPMGLRCLGCGTEWETTNSIGSDYREAVCSNCYSERVVITGIKLIFMNWGEHNGGAQEQRERFDRAKSMGAEELTR